MMTGQVECDGLTKESANTLTRHLARECQHVRIHACWNAGAMHGATGASRLAASCGWVPVVNRCRPLGGGAGSECAGPAEAACNSKSTSFRSCLEGSGPRSPAPARFGWAPGLRAVCSAAASRLAASCGWVPVVNRCRPLGGGAGSEWCGAICILHQLNQLFPNANVVHFTLCRTRSSH